MSEENGGGKSRLDRIEEMIERSEQRNAQQVQANEAAHARFEAEDKRLLTAQILMGDAMTKTNIVVEKIAQNVERMGQAMERMIQNMDKLELKMAETAEKLDALIRVVDGIIRPPAEGRQ